MTPPQSGREWTSHLAGQTPPLSGLRAMSSSPVPSAICSDGSLTPPMSQMHPHCSSAGTSPFGVPMLFCGADHSQQCWPPMVNPAWTDEDAQFKTAAYVQPQSTPRSYWNHQNMKSADRRQQELQQQKQQQRLRPSSSEAAATADGLWWAPSRWETPPAHIPRLVPSKSRGEDSNRDRKRHFRVGRRVDLCCDLHAQEWQSARVIALDHCTVRIQWASPSGSINAETLTIDDPRVRPKRVRFSLDLPVTPMEVQRQCIQQGGYARKVAHRQAPRKDCC